MSDGLTRLLLAAFHHSILEPDSEAGLDRVVALAGDHVSKDDMRLAVSEALAAGYIHDPVRLLPGALQCHWHLALTPAGVDAARRAKALPGEQVAADTARDRTGDRQ